MDDPQIKKGALVRSRPGSPRGPWTTAVAVADSSTGPRGGTPTVRLHARGRTFLWFVRHVEVISQ